MTSLENLQLIQKREKQKQEKALQKEERKRLREEKVKKKLEDAKKKKEAAEREFIGCLSLCYSEFSRYCYRFKKGTTENSKKEDHCF